MALTDAEIQRIRFELGYPNFDVAAEPYIGIHAFFTQVMQKYLLSGATTTSSTAVSASTTPTPQTLTLASAAGFAVGNVVVVDVDARQERATLSAVVGNLVTVQLTKEHSGTFPVTIEGAESFIRDILNELRILTTGMNGQPGTISSVRSRVGLKKVDDVEFFGGGNTLASQGRDPLTALFELREHWRDELANAIGIDRLNDKRNSGGSSVSVY